MKRTTATALTEIALRLVHPTTARSLTLHLFLNRSTGKILKRVGQDHLDLFIDNTETLGGEELTDEQFQRFRNLNEFADLPSHIPKQVWKGWLQVSVWGTSLYAFTNRFTKRDIGQLQDFILDLSSTPSKIELYENGNFKARSPYSEFMSVRSPRELSASLKRATAIAPTDAGLRLIAAAEMIIRVWEATSDDGLKVLRKIQKLSRLYRGMTEDEYKATVGRGKPILSTKRYSLPSEGTSFATDPGSAEGYVNFGRDDPRITGKSNYLVEVERTPTMYDDRDGYVKDREPVDTITRVWEMYAIPHPDGFKKQAVAIKQIK